MTFTSSDVVFTINMLRDNGVSASTLNFAFDMKNAVKDIVAIDPLNVKVTLNAPNSNFTKLRGPEVDAAPGCGRPDRDVAGSRRRRWLRDVRHWVILYDNDAMIVSARRV